MNKIDCKSKECIHNALCHCMKEAINVSENAFCHSFSEKLSNSFKDYMEEYSKETIEKTDDGHYIRCESTSCRSNVKERCVNPFVEFDKKDFGTRCLSYREK
ncbi:MAG: hypothetical protein PUA56_06325 [Bacillales bacterium]|nr:hypothetical protein [Bacillales bacterium]